MKVCNMKKFFKSDKNRIIGAIIIAAFIFIFGYLIGHQNLVFEKTLKPRVTNRELFKPRTVDFSIFWQAWDKIVEKYDGQPDYQKMVYGAVKGMVDALGDPYSSFMEPGQTKTFLEDLSGEISGIGAQLDLKDGKLLIVAPLAGTPAEKDGIKPQDQILKIDDQLTEGMSLEEAIDKIRGKAGTEVKLTIIRNGWAEPRDFTIKREKITVKSVKWEMKPENIAYISISQFGDDTTVLMKQAAKEIAAKNPKAIILDLRSNPGGYLESAVDVTSLFVPKGSVVVKEQDNTGKIIEEKTTMDPILEKYKVIVLVDGGSASSSEITAGALQDLRGAALIGEQTFGKGSVQDLAELQGGATLRLTIAKWLTPNNRAINKVGIEPNIKVGFTQEDADANRDPQLEKALEEANK